MSDTSAPLVDLLATLLGAGSGNFRVISLPLKKKEESPAKLIAAASKKDDVDALKAALAQIGDRLTNESGTTSTTLLGLLGDHGAIKCFPVLVEALQKSVNLAVEFKKINTGNPLLMALNAGHFGMVDYLMTTYKSDIDLPSLRAHIPQGSTCLLGFAALTNNVPMWTWLIKHGYPTNKPTVLDGTNCTLIDFVLGNPNNTLFWAGTLACKYKGRIEQPIEPKMVKDLLALGFKPEQFVQEITQKDLAMSNHLYPEYKQQADIKKSLIDEIVSMAKKWKEMCDCPRCTERRASETTGTPDVKTTVETKADVAPAVETTGAPKVETKADVAPAVQSALITENPSPETAPSPAPPSQQSTSVSVAEMAASKEELLVPCDCPIM